MTGLVTAWLTEVVLITYRASKKGSSNGTAQVPFPRPGLYAGSFLIYGALGLLPNSAGSFAALVGWGIVVATFLNLYNPLPSATAIPTVATKGQQNAVGNTAA